MLEGVKEKCPIWSFPVENLQEVINTARSAFKKIEVVEVGGVEMESEVESVEVESKVKESVRELEKVGHSKDKDVELGQVGQLSLF